MRAIIRVSVAVISMAAATASAQPAPAPAAIETTLGWSAQAGYETFSLRDVSRTTRPPDASPIAWRGGGTTLAGHFMRSGLRSAHLVDALVTRTKDFSYVSPTRSVDASGSDSAGRFDIRYEYRRYFFRDVGLDGLDIGTGLQAIGLRVAFDRYITPALFTKTRISGGGLGAVVSLRVRRWERAQVDVTWANGEIVSRLEAQHSASPEPTASSGGGEWFTDLSARMDWRLTPATKLSVTWRRGYEGYQSNHYHYSANRQSLNFGVLYGR